MRNGDNFIISTGNKTADIEIFNAAGEIVAEYSNVAEQITFLPENNGLYIVNVKSDKTVRTFKVMK